jgi:hypothetical protein
VTTDIRIDVAELVTALTALLVALGAHWRR